MDREMVNDRLRDAIVEGDEASWEALAAAGPIAVESFRDLLAGERRPGFPTGRDRDLIDNTTSVSCRLASRFPDEYVAAFRAPRWRSVAWVLDGYGYTRLPEVRPILIEALLSDLDWTTRMSAASSLGSFPGTESVQALLAVLDDPEYLIRYHAIRSLGTIGDQAALDRLLPLVTDPASRGVAMAATAAVRSITGRLGVMVDLPEIEPLTKSVVLPPEDSSS